jgi:RNA-directed DNA polymerase
MWLSRDDVSSALGLTTRELTWWVWALREPRRYDEFEIARRSGDSPRTIHAPIKPIKDVQRRLVRLLEPIYDSPVHVHGFVTSRSPITNARRHRRKEWVLRVDLANFFPSINFGRVRGLFRAYPFDFPSDVATLLAAICCHRNQLPQGAPTSPLISNFLCRGMDTRLAELARTERCHYSRYADDLCFSTDRRSFPPALASRDPEEAVVGPTLSSIIHDHGFRINEAKTRLTRRTQRQIVTGLVVNEKLNVPRSYVRGLEALLYIWRRYGEDDATAALARSGAHPNWPPGKSPAEFRQVVRGRVQYVGSVKGWTDPVYLRLADELADVDDTFRRPIRSTPAAPQTVHVYCEGPSDDIHIAHAFASLRASGAFADVDLVIKAYGDARGQDELLKYTKFLKVNPQSTPCVCLFDRDSPNIIRQVTIGNSGWKNWGNGVASVVLASPAWRLSDEPLCVEMLYPDEVLRRTDSEGRRIYLRSEFDSNGLHESRSSFTPHPRSGALVREDVIRAEDSASIAMSKMAFAEGVRDGTSPFENVSVEGFVPTFERVRQAVAEIARETARE